MKHIIILIDTSFSMEKYINDVVQSLNNFIQKLKFGFEIKFLKLLKKCLLFYENK